jgi:hypothetical protein
MKLNTTVAIAAALVAGCTVKDDQRSLLVGFRIIRATAGGTNGCEYNPGTEETTFGTFVAGAGYTHALLVNNRLPDNAALGPGRLNTNDFQVEGATITTDVVVGPAQSIATQTVPANGFIPAGGTLPIGIQIAQPGAIAAGSDVVFHIQVFGKLADGSRVRTNTYEYAAHAVGSLLPTSNCTGTTVPTFCESSDPTGATKTQDTGAICQ